MKVQCGKCKEHTGHARIRKVGRIWIHKFCRPAPRHKPRKISRRQRIVLKESRRSVWSTLWGAFKRQVEGRS